MTLVLTALAAGASAGLTGTATRGISDAYAELKGLLRRCFVGRDPKALDADETEPEAWRTRLGGQLTAADVDDEVRAAAERLLAATDPAGSQAGKYTVDVREAKGVQVGDNNTQDNTFN
ncbi:MAG: RIP homotypic interaction motif-containing protein [Pseudonocardia sp.]